MVRQARPVVGGSLGEERGCTPSADPGGHETV
jgi:hypothetical protein